ncbi:hypothetical protein [Nonomuraea zeae]|uniref:Outer membrane channel protein CpnT-like N-terminal domain-containing protein n=1 Tax=Nonomuraea zeae TaxID=1642303 RepID=A0A5S4G258_9ACTN|nr:hypothetical protein [Nonomuraea zeae]TMR27046.1 hypothetical protein ETD85_40500 [Nonomuraea zeae]
MGVMLPPELSGFMGMIGMPWPNIDEDQIRKDAAAWRVVQAGSEPAGAEADASVRRTQAVYRGESATALAGQWNKLGGEGGHITEAAAASRLAPVALEGTAGVVSAVKVAVGMQAASGLTAVVQAVAFGGAVGVTAATARMYMTRHAMGKVLREGGEGTGKVLAPALARRVTDPMRRILGNLRRPGGPGSPALAGAGGRGIPMRPAGVRASSGPRSVQDGMAKMGRRNNRSNSGNSGGRGGGRRSGSRDQTGKFHGEIPQSTRNMTAEEKAKLKKDLEESIKTRKKEEERLGYEAGHAERINREQSALRRLFGRGGS